MFPWRTRFFIVEKVIFVIKMFQKKGLFKNCNIYIYFFITKLHDYCRVIKNVSGYVCNHGSPNGERDTASPRGRYGERLSVTRVWRYIFKNTTCWPATAHDVTTGVPQYKCRREDTSSASSSEACVRSMVQSLGDAVSRSPFGEPWLHT